MNEHVQENLDQLKREIGQSLHRCVVAMMANCEDMEESVRAMDKIVDLLSEHHQQAVYALVGSILDIEAEQGQTLVPHKEIRRYIYEAAESFTKELLLNMRHNLQANGHPDVLDPNASLREELQRTLQ